MVASYYNMKWLIPLAIHLGFVRYVVGTATFDTLDEILLTDIMSSYITHEESTCSPDTASSTSFSFEFQGTNTESNWNPDLVGYESDMFQAIMSHNDTEGDRSWEIRIGLNGVIYSHFVKDMYGETLPPQSREDAPWIDDVIQTVAVVGELNQQTVLPQFCEGDTTESCRKMFVHQAGAYQRDEENLNTTDAPFYSATLAKHCQGNYCMFASWGQQAHVETPFTSPIMFINMYTNCGNGKIEHTQMIHNFAPDGSPSSDVLYDYFNVGWGGVRSSSLPYAMESNPQNEDDSLYFGHPAEVDYVPLCAWSQEDEGRQVPTDISALNGYTTFVGPGLSIDRSITLPCSLPGGCSSTNLDECMRDSCTDAQITNEGYKRISLASPPRGPKCVKDGTYEGQVTLRCSLSHNGIFGQTSTLSRSDPCAPWSNSTLGLKNTETKQTLEVVNIRHWAGLPARTWCAKPDGCTSATRSTCMVPCDESEIPEGHTRMPLEIAATGANCQWHNPRNGGDAFPRKVSVKCDLRPLGFGQTRPPDGKFMTGPLTLYNTANGKTLDIHGVRYWSWNPNNRHLVFHSTVDDVEGDEIAQDAAVQEAVAMANAAFDHTSNAPVSIMILPEVYFTVSETDEQVAIDTAANFFANDSEDSIPIEVVEVVPVDTLPAVLPKPWCRKIEEPCITSTRSTCMVPCEDENIPTGYSRMPLEIASTGPNCQHHNPNNGDPFPRKINIKCDLRPLGWGQTKALDKRYMSGPLTFKNTANNRTLDIHGIRYWSWNPNNMHLNFHSAVDDVEGDPAAQAAAVQEALLQANTAFENTSGQTVPLELIYNSYSTSAPTTAALPTFTYIYGKGDDYELNGSIGGRGRRRVGSTQQGVGKRDFTVFTVNWWHSGALLPPGDTYLNRGFLLSSDLGSVKTTADNLVEKTYIDRIEPQDYTSRAIDLYSGVHANGVEHFVAVLDGVCNSPATLRCSGKSTPSPNHLPFFLVTCGESTYLGRNPYHFTPDFGAEFPAHGSIEQPVKAYVCDGQNPSLRPTWKLIGYFDSNCTESEGITYHDDTCDSLFPWE